VIVTITLVAAGACWLPAWRASRLDPNVVLKKKTEPGHFDNFETVWLLRVAAVVTALM